MPRSNVNKRTNSLVKLPVNLQKNYFVLSIELIKLESNLFIKARSISKIQAIYRAKVAVVILKYDYMTFLKHGISSQTYHFYILKN